MRTGEQWRVSELRYRRLFETAKDGIILLDADTDGLPISTPSRTAGTISGFFKIVQY
jgi:PAS domain-containing protein